LSVRIGNRREVFAANRIAHAAGLRVGMAVTKAQALVPASSSKMLIQRPITKGWSGSPFGRCGSIRPSWLPIRPTGW
jgi:hypothetical protein